MIEADSKIEIYANPQELAWAAALRFAGLAEQFVRECGRFTVALSGGSTPKAMLSLLAQKPFSDSLPWAKLGEAMAVDFIQDGREQFFRLRAKPQTKIKGLRSGNAKARLYNFFEKCCSVVDLDGLL